MIFTSTSNERIKNLKKLNQKKYRDLYNKFLIEGEHLVEEAYNQGYLQEVIVLDGYDVSYKVEKIIVNEKVMKFITQLDHPCKVIGVCNKINNKKIGSKVVVLDNIQDPGNLGTIIRSCVAFNIDTLIISSDSVDLYNSKVIRSTQGMLFKLNIIISDIDKEVMNLIDKGYKVIGTDVSKGSTITSFKKCTKFVLVMGNEGNGVSDDIKKLCDDFIYIDMNKDCESLNVGVATSIILYELNK